MLNLTPTEFMSYAGPAILLIGQVWHYYSVKDRLEKQTKDLKQTNAALAQDITTATVQVAQRQTEDIRENSAEMTQHQTEELRDSSDRKLENLETATAKNAEVVKDIKVLVNGSTEALKAENASLRQQLEALQAEASAAPVRKPKKRA